mmetsp:Transcript_128197/g.222272  ORF Transcript_128197/g.222272 Transcript_128197/m.222272 type:complete len:221 (-) Transcript_128197:50-712(-)
MAVAAQSVACTLVLPKAPRLAPKPSPFPAHMIPALELPNSEWSVSDSPRALSCFSVPSHAVDKEPQLPASIGELDLPRPACPRAPRLRPASSPGFKMDMPEFMLPEASLSPPVSDVTYPDSDSSKDLLSFELDGLSDSDDFYLNDGEDFGSFGIPMIMERKFSDFSAVSTSCGDDHSRSPSPSLTPSKMRFQLDSEVNCALELAPAQSTKALCFQSICAQ